MGNNTEADTSGKQGLDNEEIKSFLKNGWSFRVKAVKGKQYLSLRKSGKEKGLGLLTPELRNLMDTLNNKQEGEDNVNKNKTILEDFNYIVTLHPTKVYPSQEKTMFSRAGIESAVFDIKFERAKIKAINCNHSNNGYCEYWKYPSKSPSIKKIYENFPLPAYSSPSPFNSLEQNQEILQINELLCFECEKYEQRISL